MPAAPSSTRLRQGAAGLLRRGRCRSANSKPTISPWMLRMFEEEWLLQRETGAARRIAIIDRRPASDTFCPEFLLVQRLFLRWRRRGSADGSAFATSVEGCWRPGSRSIWSTDGLVDFSLTARKTRRCAAPISMALSSSHQIRMCMRFTADEGKSSLCDRRARQRLPRRMLPVRRGAGTVPVTLENAERLWAARRSLFFKPFGSTAARRSTAGKGRAAGMVGDCARWICHRTCVARRTHGQARSNSRTARADVWLYAYSGRILFTAARLYQGRVTHFRTPGGGFTVICALRRARRPDRTGLRPTTLPRRERSPRRQTDRQDADVFGRLHRLARLG